MSHAGPVSREDVLATIPHRDPFLLVDEIVSVDGNKIHCRKHFSPDEPFCAGHYPGFPLVPGVLLCEAAMQAGAILLSRHVKESDGRVPVATRMNEVRFKRMVRPGESIEIEAELIEQLADAFFMRGKVMCDGQVAVRLEFACMLAPRPATS